MESEALEDSLKKLGCDWTHDDWDAYFGKLPAVNIFDSMRLCAIVTAAKIIVNMKDPFMRSWCDDRFLSADNDESIYHFVRIMTGDESFTKENIDQRNNG